VDWRASMIGRDNIHSFSIDNNLRCHFKNFGVLLEDESYILGMTVADLIRSGIGVNNKNIILRLIKLLKASDDAFMSDIIRKTLEIVLLYTNDDI